MLYEDKEDVSASQGLPRVVHSHQQLGDRPGTNSPSEPPEETIRVRVLSRIQLFATPWTVAYQLPLSMRFSRQEYWIALLCFPPGDLPNPGIGPAPPAAPALQADSAVSHGGSRVEAHLTYKLCQCQVRTITLWQSDTLQMTTRLQGLSVTTQNCYSVTDRIPYVVHYIPMTRLFYNWKFVSLNPLHLFHPVPTCLPSGSHSVLSVHLFCF